MSWFFRKKSKDSGNALAHTDIFTRDALSFDALEPRLLLSADAFGGVVDGDDADTDVPLLSNYDKIRDDLHHKWVQTHPSLLARDGFARQDDNAVAPEQSNSESLDLTLINDFFSGGIDQSSEIKQLVFVDASVEDSSTLLRDATSESSVKVITINASDNPLREMSEHISSYDQLDSIHIVSHASAGQLVLGGTLVDAEFLQQEENIELIASWKESTNKGADLLVYGCQFAEGEAGETALKLLSEQTGLDVAASDDVTGESGDWELESAQGQIETNVVVGLDVQAIWGHSLATIVVSSTEDVTEGGIITVDSLLDEDNVTLREAVQAVNWDVSGEVHTIVFDLPDAAVINLDSTLTLNTAMIIDGSNDGNSVTLSASSSTDIFKVPGKNIEIKNLTLSGGDEGIAVSGNDNVITGNRIVNNFGDGIALTGNRNQIGGETEAERNIISGNSDSGIRVSNRASGNTIEGNWIGVTDDGSAAWGNSGDGITINTASNITVKNNVLSGSGAHGLQIYRDGDNQPRNFEILGNIIGLDASGTSVVANVKNGLEIWEVDGANIGNGTEAGRNIISGNELHGIHVVGVNTKDITISGNYIGTDITGNVAFGNAENGVEIYDGPETTAFIWDNDWDSDSVLRIVIGGATEADGNIISNNGAEGILIHEDASYVGISNNIIGLNAAGTEAMGNALNGIRVNTGGDSSSEINAEVYIKDNVIAYNGLDGINIEDPNTYGVHIYENTIFANTGLSIDLGENGLEENDAGDFDAGANRLLNYPEISSVQIIDGKVNIQGSLNIHSSALGDVVIDFYSSEDSGGPDTAYAREHIGSYVFDADYVDTVNFDLSFDVKLSTGSYITASAHILNNTGTSELAPAIQLEQGNVENSDPVGGLLISGVLVQGATLSLTNNINDANGVSSSITYQWRRDGIAIAGANEDTYLLQQADVGSVISVSASFTDDEGYDEYVESNTTAVVANVNDDAVGTATIAGERQEGSTLNVSYSIADPDGTASSVYSYTWYRDGVTIVGAESESYTLDDEDVGARITVSVSFTDDLGGSESILSNQTAAISNVNDSPTGGVTLDGVFTEDQTLSVNTSQLKDLDGLPASFSYSWYRDDSLISGAADNTYTLSDADVGTSIHVVVTYEDEQGTIESVKSTGSASVSNINDNPDGNLTITGSNVDGETLSAVVNFTDADGITGAIDYQWYRDNVAITGATAKEYTVNNADVNTRLSVTATYTDDRGGVETVTSDQTGLVNNTNQAPTGSINIVGAAEEDSRLSVVINLVDYDGLPDEYTYQWYRDGEAVVGATEATYLLGDADVSAIITAEVSYIDDLGSSETVTSSGVGPISNINDSPEGDISIIGSKKEGGTLSAEISITDDDGISGSQQYQWLRDGVEIPGATALNYMLTEEDVGSHIGFRYTYVDGRSYVETFESNVIGPISNLNQSPNGTVDIVGNLSQGEALNAHVNITDGDGLPDPSEFSYQWFRDGESIDAANASSYSLTQDDVGSRISVSVAYIDLHDTDELITSIPSNVVINTNDPATGGISILGSPEEYQTLTVENTVSDPDGIANDLGYQWYRDGVIIPDATTATYTLTNDDVGSDITVSWSYLDNYDQSETIISDALGSIKNQNSTPTGEVTLQGDAIEGATLSILNTIEDSDGLGSEFRYQWYRGGEAIDGATDDSYTLGDDDVNQDIQVLVSYTDSQGTEESMVSNTLATTAGVNDEVQGSLVLIGDFTEDESIIVKNHLVDADGLPDEVTYSWYRDGVLIDGQSTPEYTLSDVDVGQVISISVSYTDLQGFENSYTVVASSPVSAVNDAPTGEFILQGEAIEDSVLTLIDTIEDDDGIPEGERTYAWYRDGMLLHDVQGSTYMLGDEDVDARVSVEFTYTDGQGFIQLVSAETSTAVVNTNDVAQGVIKLSGEPAPGQTLNVEYDIEDADGVASKDIHITWLRNGQAIPEANGLSYEIQPFDSGTEISVRIEFEDMHGSNETLLSSVMKVSQEVMGTESALETAQEEVNDSPVVRLVDTLVDTANENSNESIDIRENEELPSSAIEDKGTPNAQPGKVQVSDHLSPPINIFDNTLESNTILDSANLTLINTFDVKSLTGEQSVQGSASFEADIGTVRWVSSVLADNTNSIPDLSTMLEVLNSVNFTDSLNRDVQEFKDDNVSLTSAVVGGTAAASTSLSVGYLIWTMRSGVLMTSLLSSLPAWRFVDPLPILGKDVSNDDDDESLEEIVEEQKRQEQAQRRKHSA